MIWRLISNYRSFYQVPHKKFFPYYSSNTHKMKPGCSGWGYSSYLNSKFLAFSQFLTNLMVFEQNPVKSKQGNLSSKRKRNGMEETWDLQVVIYDFVVRTTEKGIKTEVELTWVAASNAAKQAKASKFSLSQFFFPVGFLKSYFISPNALIICKARVSWKMKRNFHLPNSKQKLQGGGMILITALIRLISPSKNP